MKICVVTGTRADYGLLKPLIDCICDINTWQLQVLVTGAHLSPEFGLTYKQIEQDGVHIDRKVDMLLSSDTPEGIVKSMGLGMIGYAEAFGSLQPDLVVILGDRYEMLAVSAAALIYQIPVAHIHGGEITEGTYDESIRHAITKMSHFHFASTEEYRKRIIQMGEQPSSVFNVGALGIDNIKNMQLLEKSMLEEVLQIKFLQKNFLVTFHPATLEKSSSEEQFGELLKAIDQQEDSYFIFTKANADTNGRIINEMIDAYVDKHPATAVAFTSMGQLRYLSAMKIVDAVVGNSSSGIIESPSFNVAAINIGDRQKGRLQAANVINTAPISREIAVAFRQIQKDDFRQQLINIINPFGIGNSAKLIVNILQKIDLSKTLRKPFFNI